MADTKISAMTALTAPATTDELAVVDDDTNATKKITLANLMKVVSSLTALGAAPDVANDDLLIIDGAATPKYVTVTELLTAVSSLTELATAPDVANDDLLIIDGAATPKYITVTQLLKGISSLTELAAAPDATADDILINDGATTPKYINLTNLMGVVTSLAAITSGYHASEDEMLILDNGTAKKTTLPNLLAGIEDATSAIGTTPDDTDTLLLIDGGTAKTVTVSNLMAAGGGGGRARLSLPVTAAHLSDDSTGSAAAQIQKKTSSDATDPQLFWVEALFDADTDEHIYYQFLMPDNYASAPVVDVYYKCTSATEGTAAFGARLAAVTDGDEADVDANKLADANVGTATVPGTAGYMDVISITMTNADSVAANDFVVLCVFRDISGDSVAADIEVPLVVLRYTST